MPEERKSEKVRLNITVDKETAEKAKDMGFNISAAFEEYLRVLIYRPKADGEDIIKAYDSFLLKIYPILKQYDIMIEIGEITEKNPKASIDYYGCKIFLDKDSASILKDGKYYVDGGLWQEYDLFVKPEETKFLHPPEKILKNLISEIRKAANNNTTKVTKLNLAMRFAEALFNDLEDSSESGIETPLFRRILEDVEKTKSAQITDSVENKEIIA